MNIEKLIKIKLEKIFNFLIKIKNDIDLSILSDLLDWIYKKLELNFIKKEFNLKVNKGEIYFVNLGRNIGSELNKNRPCIIYSHYYFNNGNTITIIPIKSYKGAINRNIHVLITPSKENNLDLKSFIDIPSIRQISKKRLGFKVGNIEKKYIDKLDKKVLKYFGIKNKQ